MTRLFFTVWVTLLCAAIVTTNAETQSYHLQRRIGTDGEWELITDFAISRHSIDATAKLKLRKNQPTEVELSSDKKKDLAAAQFVYYRIVRVDGGDNSEAVSVALSPCTLVRGFEAVDSRSLILREVLRVAVGPGTRVMGLLGTGETNTFHARMLDGDECDRDILTLFKRVLVQTSVELLNPLSPRSLPDYTELGKIMMGSETKTARGKGLKKKAGDAADDTSIGNEGQFYQNQPLEAEGEVEGGDGEEEEPSRSFLEKYWVYLVVPIAFSFLQNFLANR